MAECTGRWPVAGRAANRQATQEEIPLGAPGSVDRLEGQFQRKLPRAGGPSATRPRGGIGQREYWMAPVVEATDLCNNVVSGWDRHLRSRAPRLYWATQIPTELISFETMLIVKLLTTPFARLQRGTLAKP